MSLLSDITQGFGQYFSGNTNPQPKPPIQNYIVSNYDGIRTQAVPSTNGVPQLFAPRTSLSTPNPTSSPSPTGGGGGGGGGSNNGGGGNNAAQDQYNAYLSQLNTSYDQVASQLQGQLSGLGSQKDNALAGLDTAFQGVQSQVGNQKTAASTNYDQQVSDAGNQAKNTQSQNRNVLRSLGILNSSAAGDMLTRPITQFDKVRAQLTTALNQRNNELDDYLNQQQAVHQNAVQSVISQYDQLSASIQNDLRFNDRQRADAIQAATAALNNQLANIQASYQNYSNQVGTYKTQLASTYQSVANYTQPTANTKQIADAGILSPGQQQQGISLTPLDKQKQQSGLLSAIA